MITSTLRTTLPIDFDVHVLQDSDYDYEVDLFGHSLGWLTLVKNIEDDCGDYYVLTTASKTLSMPAGPTLEGAVRTLLVCRL